MEKEQTDYGMKALFPLLLFLVLYVGCGIVFTILGTADPFWKMSRYVAIMFAILVAILCFEPKQKFGEKVEIYCKDAGRSGVIQLGLMVMLAGGFAKTCAVCGGEASVVNLGISLIPSSFLIPGIFAICAIISTCIGTSMGTLATMIPVAAALASEANLNPGMTGAAVITGAYFGDNLSMIATTTICAVRGVGADMKSKFKVNGLLALIAMIITILLYAMLSANAGGQAIEYGTYQLITILPYLAALVLALFGLDVILVLSISIALSGVIGIATGNCGFFEWTQALSTGMESMFWLAVFASMISGLVGLIRNYGGIDWLVHTVTKAIRGNKSCEYIIGALSLVLCAVIVNNVMAIMILAPIAKELGERYQIPPERLAALLDIGACIAVMIVPHGTGAMMVQEAMGCTYLDIIRYQFYPLFLILGCMIMIQFVPLKARKKKVTQ